MFGNNQPYSAKGHDVEGLENPKAVGTPTAVSYHHSTTREQHTHKDVRLLTSDRLVMHTLR